MISAISKHALRTLTAVFTFERFSSHREVRNQRGIPQILRQAQVESCQIPRFKDTTRAIASRQQ